MTDFCCIECSKRRPQDVCPAIWCPGTTEKPAHCLARRYSSSKQEQVPNPTPEKEYNARVRISYSETKNNAKNIKYKLIEHCTKKVLKEGTIGENGLTEKITTEKAVSVDVIIFRLNDDRKEIEKDIGCIWTNAREDTIEVVEFPRSRIFFDFRYVNSVKDPAKSFIHAADTIKRKAYYVDKYRGDVWWPFEVTTECDIKNKWKELYELQQKTDMEIRDGYLVTHATKDGQAFDRMRNVGDFNAVLVDWAHLKDSGTGKAIRPYIKRR